MWAVASEDAEHRGPATRPVDSRDEEALRGPSRGAAARGAALGGRPDLTMTFRVYLLVLLVLMMIDYLLLTDSG